MNGFLLSSTTLDVDSIRYIFTGRQKNQCNIIKIYKHLSASSCGRRGSEYIRNGIPGHDVCPDNHKSKGTPQHLTTFDYIHWLQYATPFLSSFSTTFYHIAFHTKPNNNTMVYPYPIFLCSSATPKSPWLEKETAWKWLLYLPDSRLTGKKQNTNFRKEKYFHPELFLRHTMIHVMSSQILK